MSSLPPKVIASVYLIERVISDLDILITQIPAMANLPGPKIPSKTVKLITDNTVLIHSAVKLAKLKIQRLTGIPPVKADIPSSFKTRQEWYNALMKAKNDWVGFVLLAKPYINTLPDAAAENKIITTWIVQNIKPYI